MSGPSRGKTPLQIAEEQLQTAEEQLQTAEEQLQTALASAALAAEAEVEAEAKAAAALKEYDDNWERMPYSWATAKLGGKVEKARGDAAWAAENNVEAAYEVAGRKATVLEMKERYEKMLELARKTASQSKKKKKGSSKTSTGGRSRKKRCRHSRKKRRRHSRKKIKNVQRFTRR